MTEDKKHWTRMMLIGRLQKIDAVTARFNELVVRADEDGKQPHPAVPDDAEDADKKRKDDSIRMSMHWIIDDEVRIVQNLLECSLFDPLRSCNFRATRHLLAGPPWRCH